MAAGRLAPAEFSPQEPYVSAPSSAVFYLLDGLEKAAEQSVDDIILDSEAARGEGDYVTAIFGLRQHMSGLIGRYKDQHDRNKTAIDYACYYRDELRTDTPDDLTYDEQSSLMVAQVYLSALETLGQLGIFIETGRWTGRKSEDFADAKLDYLASRKKFQDDVDEYIDHFAEEPSEILYPNLIDTVNLARLTLKRRPFVTAEIDDHTHEFLGSVLSERAVMVSLRQHVHPETRYGTEEEDRSPTKADVVFPIPKGDMYVQVKMRWKKESDLKVQPKKQPPHVVMPMTYLRAHLTAEEDAKVAEIISAAAERKNRQLEIDEALALGGLKKYRALAQIPMRHFKEWWEETKDVIKNEPADNVVPLQTGVDKVQLAA